MCFTGRSRSHLHLEHLLTACFSQLYPIAVSHNFKQVQPGVLGDGILSAGKYRISGSVKDNSELNFKILNLAGQRQTSHSRQYTCTETTSLGKGTFSGRNASPPKLGLGPVSHYSDYTDDLVSSILNAGKGGQATTDYFNTVNILNQLFQSLAGDQGSWSTATDSATGLPIQYVAYTDSNNHEYYIKIGPEELQTDSNGNVVTNGSTATIDGVDYQGIGMITMTCGYSNYTFSKTCWWLGTTTLTSQIIWAIIGDTVKAAGKAVIQGIACLSPYSSAGQVHEDKDVSRHESK